VRPKTDYAFGSDTRGMHDVVREVEAVAGMQFDLNCRGQLPDDAARRDNGILELKEQKAFSWSTKQN
jgi:hypothetical protein